MATRKLAEFVFQLGGGKGNFNDHWPLDGKEKTIIEPPTREWWDRMKEKQKNIDKSIAEIRNKK